MRYSEKQLKKVEEDEGGRGTLPTDLGWQAPATDLGWRTQAKLGLASLGMSSGATNVHLLRQHPSGKSKPVNQTWWQE